MEKLKLRNGMLVVYCPAHCNGDLMHEDVELGKVSSCSETHVHVKFGEQQTSKACRYEDLVLLK